uniref:Secreted protein n=1 Tax=Mesocestoides corti TaxID=53468 RepID=A0A5K3EUP9_MESCO
MVVVVVRFFALSGCLSSSQPGIQGCRPGKAATTKGPVRADESTRECAPRPAWLCARLKLAGATIPATASKTFSFESELREARPSFDLPGFFLASQRNLSCDSPTRV